MSDYEDGLKDFGSIGKMESSERIDALEVNLFVAFSYLTMEKMN